MKVGSFLLILLVALVVLGYLLSDSFHLREDISNQQKEIGQLTQAVQQAEQEKQNALIALQTANQNLQSCQLSVGEANQTIARLTDENMALKAENQSSVTQQASDTSSAIPRLATKTIQATTFGLFTFLVLGVGSAVAIGLKSFQKYARHGVKIGQYVYLTNDEIKDLIRQRRASQKSNTS